MDVNQYTQIFIAVTTFSVIAGYITSLRAARKKYGEKYMSVVNTYQWKCAKGIAPIALYIIIAFANGDFHKLLNGVAFSMAAVSFFALSAHELSMGFTLNHGLKSFSHRVALLSRINIIGLILSVVTVVLVFQAESVDFLFVVWQAIIFVASIFSFYANGSVVNLVKVGYVSQ